jgi:copper homeostasis protein
MILLETIAASVEDCLAAEQGGANRIELVSALAVGGLTPSLGLLREARRATRLPIMAMLRPRASGFAYSAREWAVVLRDAELFLADGADGLVFGALHPDGAVDLARVAELVALAGNRETVFHRAFDVTPEPLPAIERLADLGVTRILTSGQEANAYNGAAAIRGFRERAAGRIQILPGGGVNRFTVADILRRTGADQVHASLSVRRVDLSLRARPQVTFGAGGGLAEDEYFAADVARIAELRAVLDGLSADF